MLMHLTRRIAWTSAALLVSPLWLSPSLGLADEAVQVSERQYTQAAERAAAKGDPVAETPAKPKRNVFAEGPEPSWIWGADPSKKYVLRKTFDGGHAKTVLLRAACDNVATLSLNGKKLGTNDNWNQPLQRDIKAQLVPGANVIEAEVSNGDGPAGFVAKIVLLGADGAAQFVVTDTSWQVAETRDAKETVAAAVTFKFGDHPGGKTFNDPAEASPPRDLFNLLPGFQVERLFTVPKETLGSWVNITSDPKGRLIVSDQGNLGFCRVTPPKIGSSDETKVEHLDIKFIDEKEQDETKRVKPMSGAQGLLWAFDSLYVVCNGGPGSGLYRCKDTDGDDQFDEVVKLRDIPGSGEHGPHAIRLSPDGKSLYVIAGNHTKLPFEIKTNAPPQTMGGQRTEQLRATLPEGVTSRLMPNWDEDVLLPRYWDPSGHAAGVLAPGGWICKIDPEGKTWEVFSSGYRNPFDFAFNADGEMFAYDVLPSGSVWQIHPPGASTPAA